MNFGPEQLEQVFAVVFLACLFLVVFLVASLIFKRLDSRSSDDSFSPQISPQMSAREKQTIVQEGQTINVRVISETPSYAVAFGILGIIGSIAAFLIPIIGPIFLTPIVAIFGIIALLGGSKISGIITFGILLINLLVSPSFWLNFAAGGMMREASANRFFALLDIFSVLIMVPLMFVKSRRS